MREKSHRSYKWILIMAVVIIVAGTVAAIVKKDADTRKWQREAAETDANCRETFVYNGVAYSLCPYATNHEVINITGNNNLFALCSRDKGATVISFLHDHDYAWCEAADCLLYTKGKQIGTIDPETGRKKAITRVKKGRNIEIDGVIGEYAILHGVSKAGNYMVRDGEYVLLNVADGTSVEMKIDTGNMERLYPIAVDEGYLYYWIGKFTQNHTYVPVYRYEVASEKSELIGTVEDEGERSRPTESVCMLDEHIYMVMGDGELLKMDPSGVISVMDLFDKGMIRKTASAEGCLWILTSDRSDSSGIDYHVYRYSPQDGMLNEEFSFTDEDDAGIMPGKLSISSDHIIVTMRQWKGSYVWTR